MRRAVIVGLATFGGLAYVVRGVFEGGSILGVLFLLVAALVATAVGALALPTATPADPERPPRLPRKQVAVGMLGALGALLAAIVLWWMAFAAATGCSFHCDVDDRSPAAAVALTLASMAAWGTCGRLVAWSLSLRRRTMLIVTAAGAGLALAAVAVTASSFFVT